MKEKNGTSKKAIYSRKSKFTGKGESIENQITLCKEYLQAHEMRGEIIVYEDEGYSGGNIFRPQFTKMMADARAGKIDTIICYRLDRISRNIGDFAGLIDELGSLEISFVSIKEQFDTSTPMGKAMMYIASVFSQLERETIAERIRDNMQELAKTGRWLGGITPTGYTSASLENITLDGKTRKACHLKTIPEEAALITLIFNTFLNTGSLTKTETYLMQNDYKTKNGKDFTRFALKNILINPVYMIADTDAYRYLDENGVDSFSAREEFGGTHGLMVYNRSIQKPGKANQIRPLNEWIVSVGKHEGLIPGAQWIKVQRLLAENKNKSYHYRAGHTNEALLSGLLFCSCGDYMRPKLTDRRTSGGERVCTYLCAKKEKSRGKKCNSRPLNGNVLDQWVCQVVKSLSEDGSEFRRWLESNKTLFTDSQTQYELDFERVRRAMDGNRAEIQGLVTSLTKVTGTTAEDYIVKQIEALHEKGELLRARSAELEELMRRFLITAEQFEVFRGMLSTFAGTIDTMTVEQKRIAIRTVIRRIEWDGADIHLYLFGADDDGHGIEFPPFSELPAHTQVEKRPMGEDSK